MVDWDSPFHGRINTSAYTRFETMATKLFNDDIIFVCEDNVFLLYFKRHAGSIAPFL